MNPIVPYIPIVIHNTEEEKKKKLLYLLRGKNMKFVCAGCGKILEEPEVIIDPDGSAECQECIDRNTKEENIWEFEMYTKPKERWFKKGD